MDTRGHQTDTSIASLCKWTYNLPSQSFSICFTSFFCGIFDEERAMHIAGICWPAIWKSSRPWSTRIDFCSGWPASHVLPGVWEIFVLKLQRNNWSCQYMSVLLAMYRPCCKKSTGIVNRELSPQKTNHKFPGTWSSQIIFTKSFLMPNPLSWGLFVG